MADKKKQFPVHVILSSSESDEGEHIPSKFALTSTKTGTYKNDFSDDDDSFILPLRERMMKGKCNEPTSSSRGSGDRVKSKWSSEACAGSSSTDDEVTVIVEKNHILKTCQTVKSVSQLQNKSSAECSTSSSLTDLKNTFSKPKPTSFMNTLSIKNLYGGVHSDSDSLPDIDGDLFETNKFPSSNSEPISDDENDTIIEVPAKMVKRKKSKEEVLAEKEKKIQERENKLKIREEQLAMKEREKKLKEIQKQEKNSIKPDECIKNVSVMMDLNLLGVQEASKITKSLEESQVQYNLIEQYIPNCITWQRKVFHQTLEDDLQISQELDIIDENQIVIVIPVNEFLRAVNNFQTKRHGQHGGKDLIGILHQLKELYSTKRVTMVTCGVEKHFSAQKNKEQREYRQQCLNDDPLPTNNGKKRKADNKLDFTVTRLELEEALVDLQLRESCTVYVLSDAEEIAKLIISITKSIAGTQFKLGKVHTELSWLAIVDNKDSVKVDKDGNGLKLLWQRQLQQMSAVSSDTAQAITYKYPTPASLIKAYDKCFDTHQQQHLLQDILVRRGIGPLSTTKRIGPELSRKIFVLFTSKNSGEILDAYQC